MPLLSQFNKKEIEKLQHTFSEAVAAYSQGDTAKSEGLCVAILGLHPNHAYTLNLLAAVRMQQNRREEAQLASLRATQLEPDDAIIWTGRSDILNRSKNPDAALSAADQAIQLNKSMAQAHINRGIALVSLYRFSEAKKSFSEGLRINPALKPVVLGNMVLLHGEEGQYETARRIADDLANEYPQDHGFATIRARFSMYTPSVSRRDEYERTSAVWAAAPGSNVHLSTASRSADLRPGRKLKIGYFSADFRDHPVSQFLKPVLSRHDRNNFDIALYDVTPNPDSTGREVRELGDSYHCGLEQSDEELARKINSDGVDVLVDLTGQFEGNRLSVFRYRPAPIQASWIGYSGTSGLPEMDYVIADAKVCPPGAEVDFSEEIIRLTDHYLCFDAECIRDAPIPSSPKDAPNIVFGSFNNHMKLNTDVIRVWAEIMKRVQGAQLFLKSGKFSNKSLRQHIRQQFEARGIDGERLILKSLLPRDKHLAAYNDIDIALDPFPYCGTTTTIDALSMGVPVITLVGERWIQRTSYGFLKGMGMEFLCAHTEREYLNIAIKLAADRQRLLALKAEGRSKFIESRICDPVSFTEHLENAYRVMSQRLGV
ncbi:MAG: hypothetical protein P8L66_06155 [Rhodospirillaceae bacterium]|nr:hypothetical protein [Rhodospirillaceae bacterium]